MRMQKYNYFINYTNITFIFQYTNSFTKKNNANSIKNYFFN